MKIAICEDHFEDRKILRNFLEQYCLKQHLELEILEYTSAENLLEHFSTLQNFPEIIFFDIYMSGMSGIEAAQKLFVSDFPGAFIFTTTSLDHVREGYRVHAADYLIKPYSYEDFQVAMDWCKRYLQKAMKSIQFVSERFELSIYLSDIAYIESCMKNVVVHAKTRTLLTSKTISQFEMDLADEPAFLRLSRGILVNFGNIEKWNKEFLFFKNGEQLALPVRNRKKILQKLEEFYWFQITK